VDFGPGDPNVELDVFGGFAGGDATKSFAYDVGIIYYTYHTHGSSLDFPEIYGGITKGWFNVKLSYSWDFSGTGVDAYYIEGNASIPMPAGFTGLGHIGWSGGSYWDDFYGDGYFDWNVGVSHALGHFTGTLKYIDGSDLPDGGSQYFKTNGKIWAGVQTTLPWK
jgi:uncharacterized protein (TIGR02001 family)